VTLAGTFSELIICYHESASTHLARPTKLPAEDLEAFMAIKLNKTLAV
jgi:hypothetical protein